MLSSTAPATDRALDLVSAALRGPGTDQGTVLVDDVENIDQALRAGVSVLRIFHTTDEVPKGPTGSPLPGVPRTHLPARDANALFGNDRASRVFAVARHPRPARLADLVERSGDVIVLDGVRLMGNIGAVVRTAAAMGAAGVVVVDSGLTTVMDRRLIRASRGLVFTLPVVLGTREAVVRFCSANAIPLLVTDAATGAPVQELSLIDRRVALAFGSEKRGCSVELVRGSAGAVTIRTVPTVESLNVSVAAGIAMHCRQFQNLRSLPYGRPQLSAMAAG